MGAEINYCYYCFDALCKELNIPYRRKIELPNPTEKR